MYSEADVYEWIFTNKKLSFEEIDYLDPKCYEQYRLEFFVGQVKTLKDYIDMSRIETFTRIRLQVLDDMLEAALCGIKSCRV